MRIAYLNCFAGISGDIGPALINDADHAERYADPLYLHAIRSGPPGEAHADGITRGRDLCEAARHGLNAQIIEAKPIEQWKRDHAHPTPAAIHPAPK